MFGLFSKKSPPIQPGQKLVAKKVKRASAAFTYAKTRDFNENNLGRYSLPRQYTPPLSNFAGAAGIPVMRSMEAIKPAIAYGGNTLVLNDPRGLAGNGPVPTNTSLTPLVDLTANSFANPTPIG
jgi:hypothetical protein